MLCCHADECAWALFSAFINLTHGCFCGGGGICFMEQQQTVCSLLSTLHLLLLLLLRRLDMRLLVVTCCWVSQGSACMRSGLRDGVQGVPVGVAAAHVIVVLSEAVLSHRCYGL